MGSIFKKTKSLLKHGIKPIEQGLKNYNTPIIEIESLAIKRSKECIECENFVDEPIDFMAVKDDRIPELSGKMCDECGCESPYLLRQNIKICKYWNK